MASSIKPFSDRVLIEPVAAEKQTGTGILIPGTAREQLQKGIVIAVGNGTKDHQMTIKAGDTVLYEKETATELKFESKDYIILKEEEIFAIIY